MRIVKSIPDRVEINVDGGCKNFASYRYWGRLIRNAVGYGYRNIYESREINECAYVGPRECGNSRTINTGVGSNCGLWLVRKL